MIFICGGGGGGGVGGGGGGDCGGSCRGGGGGRMLNMPVVNINIVLRYTSFPLLSMNCHYFASVCVGDGLRSSAISTGVWN